LEEFARKVHVPFGYLFLEEPPEEALPIPYFRTGQPKSDKVSLNVYDTILLLQKRQEWLSDYLQEKGYDPLPMVGRFGKNANYREIVADILNTLQLPEDWAKAFPTWEEALKHLTAQIEEAGIVVTFNSVVGNNTKRKIPVDECRGFVLVDAYAPFMFINNDDAKAARMFTLIHELAHIWIGESAGLISTNYSRLPILLKHCAIRWLLNSWSRNSLSWKHGRKSLTPENSVNTSR
jgi:hypothetical protein